MGCRNKCYRDKFIRSRISSAWNTNILHFWEYYIFPIIDGIEVLLVTVPDNRNQVILGESYDFKSTNLSCKCIKASSSAVGDIDKFKDLNRLYPNPRYNLIGLNKAFNEPYTLYNINGQMIKKGMLIFEKLNIVELHSGLYL